MEIKRQYFMKAHRRTKTETFEPENTLKKSFVNAQKTKRRVFCHSRRYQSEISQFVDNPPSKIHHDLGSHRKTRIPSNPRIQYNKWYIKPEIRMKKPIRTSTSEESQNIEFAYNKLYEQNSLKEGSPFEMKKNEKLLLLQKIPINNIRLLENFKKSQETGRKRVPKIVELFLQKKNTNEYRSSM